MGKLEWPFCQYFGLPTDAERAKLGITDPDIVLGCKDHQGSGPLYFFVPVHGGAVRVGVCPHHAQLLEQHHGPGTGAQAVTSETEVRDGKPYRRRVIVVEDWKDVSRRKPGAASE